MAAIDLDVLALGAVLVEARLPGADAVAALKIEVVGTGGVPASVPPNGSCSSTLLPLAIS